MEIHSGPSMQVQQSWPAVVEGQEDVERAVVEGQEGVEVAVVDT